MCFSLDSHCFTRNLHALHSGLCCCTCSSHVCSTWAATGRPPTHPVTISLYHFKGSVAHRPPLLHPESPLEQPICTPTVPRCLFKVTATEVCMGLDSEALQVLNPLPLLPGHPPLHHDGRNKMTCRTQVHRVRLSYIWNTDFRYMHGISHVCPMYMPS